MAASDFALAQHGERVKLFTRLLEEMPGLPDGIGDPASTEHQVALQFALGHASNTGRFRDVELVRVQEDAEGLAEKLEVREHKSLHCLVCYCCQFECKR
jgi:hypothetical protein